MEKLLKHGEGWLSGHPKREAITHRYLKHRHSLAREALARLAEHDDQPDENSSRAARRSGRNTGKTDRPQRTAAWRRELPLKASGAKRVLDLGCGEGRLLRELLREKQFEAIVGMDVAFRSLEIAKERLSWTICRPKQKDRIRLIHGSFMYRDKRLAGFDAAAVVEVIEHLDPPRLAAFERVYLSSPACNRGTDNAESGVQRDVADLVAGAFRHDDHRFEWNQPNFRHGPKAGERFGYALSSGPLGQSIASLDRRPRWGVPPWMIQNW